MYVYAYACRRNRNDMDMNYFKDKLFDVLNESDELDLSDITVDDRHDLFTVSTADGSVFELQCREK